jgi:arylsulfatase I/J
MQRRLLVRLRLFLSAVLLSLMCLRGATADPEAAEVAQRRPNIVIIIADDLGFADVGFRGSDILTPHIDGLAAEGAVLERFYTLPFCTPTRAALLTGRYPFRYGLQTAAIPADARYGLNTDEILLPQFLKQAGYRTAIVGKWHLGHAKPDYWPRHRGFDHQYGPLRGEIDYYTHASGGTRDWYRNEKPLDERGYATELIGREAEQVILSHDTNIPLFLYLTFTAPHAPYEVPANYAKRNARIKDGTRRTYAGMISSMDDQVGRVVAALEKKKMRENTFILFMSDNGGNRTTAFSGEGDVSGLVLPASNAPFRGGKGNLLEGGCRVVAVADWPKHIPQGRNDGLLHVADLLPTLTRLAGVALPKDRTYDGVDQWGMLSRVTGPVRTELVYNIEPYRAALSQGDWKLLLKASIPMQVELYNLGSDPGEARNVAAAHPEIVKRLRSKIDMLAAESRPPLFFRYAITHFERMQEIFQSLQPRNEPTGFK